MLEKINVVPDYLACKKKNLIRNYRPITLL